jgi:hypothetical protein
MDVEDVQVAVTIGTITDVPVLLELHLKLHLISLDWSPVDRACSSHTGTAPQAVGVPVRNLATFDCHTSELRAGRRRGGNSWSRPDLDPMDNSARIPGLPTPRPPHLSAAEGP